MPSSHLMMEFLHGPGWTSILHRSTVPSEPGAGGAIASQIFDSKPFSFIYSEKATKFEKISIIVLMLLSTPTSWVTQRLVNPTFGSGKNLVNQISCLNEE